jgi:hypothetical protein
MMAFPSEVVLGRDLTEGVAVPDDVESRPSLVASQDELVVADE